MAVYSRVVDTCIYKLIQAHLAKQLDSPCKKCD